MNKIIFLILCFIFIILTSILMFNMGKQYAYYESTAYGINVAREYCGAEWIIENREKLQKKEWNFTPFYEEQYDWQRFKKRDDEWFRFI